MAMTLFSLAVEFFGDMTKLSKDMDKAEAAATAQGGRIGEKAGRAIAENVRQEVARTMSSGQLLGGGDGIANALIGGSLKGAAGIGIGKVLLKEAEDMSSAAARLGFYRRQLQGISGDAKVASKAVDDLSNIAGDTNFDTPEVFSLGMNIAGRRGDVAQGVTETGEVLDAAAAMSVEHRNFNDFQRELSTIMSRGSGPVDVEMIGALRKVAPTLPSIMGKALGKTPKQIEQLLRGTTGDKVYDLIRQTGRANKGKAAAQGNSDPQSLMGQVRDNLEIGGAPTGELINSALMPLAGALAYASKEAGALNRATGGGAGLTAILIGARVAIGLVVPGVRTAIGAIGSLDRIIRRLGEDAAHVEGVRIGATGASGVGGAVLAADEERATSSLVRLATAADRAAGALQHDAMSADRHSLSLGKKGMEPDLDLQHEWEKNYSTTPGKQGLKGLLSKGGRGIGQMLKRVGPDGAAYGLSMLAEYAGGKMEDGPNARIGKDLNAAGEGMGIGATIGTFFGPWGMLIGSAVGAVGGAAVSEIQQAGERAAKQDGKDKDSAAERTAKATETMAGNLKDIKAQVLGGGPRAQWAGSQGEREYLVWHLATGGKTNMI